MTEQIDHSAVIVENWARESVVAIQDRLKSKPQLRLQDVRDSVLEVYGFLAQRFDVLAEEMAAYRTEQTADEADRPWPS